MVSLDFLDSLEMGGNERVVQYDIGPEFSGLLDWRCHPECRFELQMGEMSASGLSNGILPRQIGEHWPTYED
jgi:hypothetical protein